MSGTATKMSEQATYDAYRDGLEVYFDRTATDAWAKLTSDAPVSRIREKVRAGRDAMRNLLLGWLPADLSGKRILDAGCGTGALAVEAARRGATVVAVDVSASLIDIARERTPRDLGTGSIDFRTGDMLGRDLGSFDHVIAMDSLIHYPVAEIEGAITELASRTTGSIVFTVAPRTPLLLAARLVGQLFPRADRSPAIIPAGTAGLIRDLSHEPGWKPGRDARVSRAFYVSHALELVHA